MSAFRFAAAAAVGIVCLIALEPAQATTMSECSALYKTAQTAGTLNGMKWNDFRKLNCGASTATSTTATTSAVDATEPTTATTENAPEPAASTVPLPKNVVFPRAVSATYASQTPGKARLHTCLDQYKVDKSSNGLGGLHWIQKGGGYYSMCNTKLKG